DVPSGNVTSDSFDLVVASGGTGAAYDFSCYGPNGFQRRFVGNASSNSASLEVTAELDTNANELVLTFTNGTSSAVVFGVSDGFGMDGPWQFTVGAGEASTNSFSSVSGNSGWYDLTAVADADPAF